MSDEVTLRVTVSVTYPAKSHDYGTDDPAEMARIDAANLQDDPTLVYDWLLNAGEGDVTVRVEPVEVRDGDDA